MKQGPILVTGRPGFIGSHLVHQLLAKEAEVIASNCSGSFRHPENVRNRVEIAPADVGRFTDVRRLVEAHKPETIYHIGAMLAPACDDYRAIGIQATAIGTNKPVQELIDSVSAKPYEDTCARKEWGWKERHSLAEMVDSFLEERVA